MSSARSSFPYARLLAFLRTRLLGAVVMPALLGAAWAAREGPVSGLRLGLVLLGLAAAELLDLFGADYTQWRGQAGPGRPGTGAVILPGNPVVAPSRLEPGRIPAVLLPLALVGLGVLVYFTVAVGAEVLLLIVAAAAVGGLYVFSPFPYAFLSTAVIPPLISGGTALALTGAAPGAAFWAGVPIAWISLAVILGYRASRRRILVLGLYCLAGATVAAWVPLGFLPPAALFALAPWGGGLVWLLAIRRRSPPEADPVPATAVGVLMHTSASAALALAVWLG